MLRVDQVHVIRHKVLVEGRPIRAVAREMGVSRNTVRKYLQESEPIRRVTQARSCPVREQVREGIEELLEAWRGRTTPKQRVTGSRLHAELVGEGLAVGVTTVREHVVHGAAQLPRTFAGLPEGAQEPPLEVEDLDAAVSGIGDEDLVARHRDPHRLPEAPGLRALAAKGATKR